eukprot:TRINITY_DN5968_c0_g1_i1.p1 TRINITY_DN5968_c0_g1~~TRINITY_DN5968_c0_g1_i1.p1  ORF type:complete len:991 (-),score=293.49 TRINITY_DN5968_c0_g1_i1:21-2588(-)
MVKLVFQNLKTHLRNPDPIINFCSTPQRETLFRWIIQTRKLLTFSAQRLLTRMDTHLQLLSYLLTPDILVTATPEQRIVASNAMTSYMVKRGFYSVMRELLMRFEPNAVTGDTEYLMQFIIALILRPMQYIPDRPSHALHILVVEYFQVEILSIPNLNLRLPSNLFSSLAAVLRPVVFLPPPTFKTTADSEFLVSNMSVLLKTFLTSVQLENSRTAISNYVKYLCVLLIRTNAKEFFVGAQPKIDLADSIRTLADPFVVETLWNLFLSDNSEKTRGNFVENHTGLIYLSELYNILLSFKSLLSLQHILVYKTPIVKKLWSVISKTPDLIELIKSGASEEKPEFCGMLILIAKCYSHVLLTLDDREFFDEQKFLPLKEIEALARVLRELVFANYWNVKESVIVKDREKRRFRKALTNLLKLLYDRNSRHVFCTAETWISPQFPARPILQDEKISQILQNIPFVVPFTQRVSILRDTIDLEKQEYQADPYVADTIRVRIRRDYVFDDAYSQLGNLKPDQLRRVIRVELISANGLPEMGIDGGGVFKEFITQLIQTAYAPTYGLFRETPERFLYPNPSAVDFNSEASKQFEFLGKLLAKCIYENILVELPFANFFLSKLLKKFNYINDLYFLDPALHKNLMFLKTADQVEDLDLNFTIVNTDFGKNQIVELVPNGKNVTVTDENKIRYIGLMANYKLNTQIKEQSAAFLRGFQQLIHPDLISMFNQDELQMLISGTPGGIDVQDLQSHVTYSGGYHSTHPVILRLWSVLNSFTPEEQRNFLMFVTSCSRPPLLGFGSLSPRMCIHLSSHSHGMGLPEDHLPTASTCMNFFKLPPYENIDKMRQKLLYAINSKSGFELS